MFLDCMTALEGYIPNTPELSQVLVDILTSILVIAGFSQKAMRRGGKYIYTTHPSITSQALTDFSSPVPPTQPNSSKRSAVAPTKSSKGRIKPFKNPSSSKTGS